MSTGKLFPMMPLVFCLGAQTVSAPPTFEAASIKANKSGSTSSRWDTHVGSLVAENKTLQDLVAIAYGVTDDRVSGGPGWISSDCFDIHAKAGGAAHSPELTLMLQTLLAERFQLAVHRAKVYASGYSLTVLKGGIKVQPDESEGRSVSNTGNGKIVAQRTSMASLAQTLRRLLGDPVADDTGLAGAYTFTLEWSPDAADALPDALAQQLGLKLENKKLAIDTVVVDKAEKPTEN